MADIYFLLNSANTGGAEKRMMRIAHRVAQEKLFKNVFLLVNPEMWADYSEAKDMVDILNASGLQLQFIQNTKRTPLFIRFFSRLSRMLKIQIMIDYAHYMHLKKQSYLYELLRITKHGDVIHVFLGDASRNGALLAAAYGRTVVIEIVSNRRLKRISEDFVTLLRFQKTSRSLYIKCVSHTVCDNFINALSPEARSCLAHLEPHPFAYLEPSKSFEPNRVKKQNIIMYGHRFIPSKNPILFADIVKEMHRDGQLNGWQVQFRGRGRLADALRNMLASEIEGGVVDIAYSRDFPRELLSTKIFVSIIETGNYPSQSVLEAMQAGNLLLLSDTGETKKKLFHKDICFPLLQKDAIKSGLLTLMAVAESKQFQQASFSMRTFYQEMADRDEYIQSLLKIYNAPSCI